MTITLRLPLVSLPKETTPSISLMTAYSLGLRASKSSATRGRPPVMSLVLVVSRGILAMTSPGVDLVALADHDVGAHRQEVAGHGVRAGNLQRSCPRSSLMEMRGRASGSLDSMMTLRGQARSPRPPAPAWSRLRRCRRTSPCPATSVRIGMEYGSHSAIRSPAFDLLAVLHLELGAVDDRVALALAARSRP